MKNFQQAMAAEKQYINERMQGMNVSLISYLLPYGYDNLDEYFIDKKEYLFNNWNPQVYHIDVQDLTIELERAIQNEKYGIYISTTNSLYAFHGTDDINYKLCKELGIKVAELYYKGGTIIGGPKDFGIEIVAPHNMGLTFEKIINQIINILSKYGEIPQLAGNDILINGKKIMGSMQRAVGNAFVWAAQFSFEEHKDVIEKVCNKKSFKEPGYIDNPLLNKKVLEEEIVKWLRRN